MPEKESADFNLFFGMYDIALFIKTVAKIDFFFDFHQINDKKNTFGRFFNIPETGTIR
jgi:hypothetical protein